MNSKLSRQMSILGLAALAFYASLLATGYASLEVLPQFAISAVIFLSSGRIMRRLAARLPARDDANEEAQEREEPNWELRNLILNWVAAATLVSIVALFLVKPPSMTFTEFGRFLLKVDVVMTDYHMPIAP
jgi:hypothetical protein